MTREEIGHLIAEYPSKKDTHELWLSIPSKGFQRSGDPFELDRDYWVSVEAWEFREKRRELGQWIFEGAPEWVDSAAMDNDGWFYYGLSSRAPDILWAIDDKKIDPQPTGLDHIDWKDSKIRRAT